MLTIEERVRNGSTLLSDYDSTWYNKIDLEILDVSRCCECVLGQIFGVYGVGIMRLHAIYEGDMGMAEEYGFCIYEDEIANGHESLTAEWKRVINQLRVSEIPKN